MLKVNSKAPTFVAPCTTNNNYTLKNLYEGSQKNVSLEELIKIIKKW